ncbi:hypothetical protein JYU17_00075 [Flavobacteriaceae bacterium AH-315-O20]|nr:hypothetical protein [Flavobacteriaceae bacterium AH-315-O20]
MKKATNIYDRTLDLKEKLNDFLSELTNNKKDYYNSFTQSQLLDLKMAVSDINNVLTLKTTLAFSNWIANYFNLSNDEHNQLTQEINRTKPNTNGFDVQVQKRKIIAEIKCIIPINKGFYYGAAQRNSILDDAIKLTKGKRELPDTSEYIKLIGLIDLGEKTDKAIEKLIKPAKNIRTETQLRLERHGIVHKLRVIDSTTKLSELTADYVYLKKIKIASA